MDETPTDNPDSLSDDEPSQTELLTLLETLRSEHRAIDMEIKACLLYTSPSPRDQRGSRMPSSA